MDYQKMWYVMKDRLMKEGERIGLQPDYRKAADDHLKLMSEIEIKAMAESQRVCECGGCCSDGEPEPPKGRQAKPDSETTADKYGDTEKKPEGSDILKRIFGDDFVSDAETLKKDQRGQRSGYHGRWQFGDSGKPGERSQGKENCDCSCTLRRDQHGKGCRQHAVSIPVSSWIPEIIQRH